MIDVQAIHPANGLGIAYYEKLTDVGGSYWAVERPVVAFARCDGDSSFRACVFDDFGVLVFADSLPSLDRIR